MGILDHKGKKLVPVQMDSHTWVLLPPEKATKKTALELKKKIIHSRELAIRNGCGVIHDYEKL